MGVYTHTNLDEQSLAIESLPAPPSEKFNGKKKVVKTMVAGLGQLDAMWGDLPEDIKARILNLANEAAK